MARTVHIRVRAAASAVLTVLALAACTGRDDGTSGPSGNGAVDTSALGTPKKATGTPIKVGFVNDGKGAQIDNSGMWVVAQATAKYANEYLNGINGHVIEFEHCESKFSPSGGTACGVKFKNDKVAAVLASTTAYDTQVSDALGSGIPFFANASGSTSLLTGPNRYVLYNALAQLGAQINASKEKKLKKAASVIIDVPAAAAVGGIIGPIYQKAGLQSKFILISAKVADHTSQVQQAISEGADSFSVNGSTTFFIADLKALRQVKFTGPIVVQINSQEAAHTIAAAVPGGLEGMINATSVSTDPTNADVKLLQAVKAKYAASAVTGDAPEGGFIATLSLVRALTGNGDPTDAAAVTKALQNMPAIDQPMGGGIKFQCGKKVIGFIPNECASQYLTSVLDKDGNGSGFTLGDVKPFL